MSDIKASTLHHHRCVSVCYLGYQLSSSPTPAALPAMVDTGWQSCLAGIKVLRHLGMSTADLIPVNMKMHAANNNAINIIGAVVLRFCDQSASGDSLKTQQLTYITDSSDKLFVSREACVALGMISPKFPRIGEALTVQESDSVDSGPKFWCTPWCCARWLPLTFTTTTTPKWVTIPCHCRQPWEVTGLFDELLRSL